MVNSRVFLAAFLLAANLPAFLPAGHAAPTTQSSDDLAGGNAPIVVRFNPKGPDEAEVSLRAAIIMARYTFLRSFQEQLLGRKPTEADIGSPAYTRALAEVARSSPAHFPFDQLTSLWVNDRNDETLVLTLAQPIRQAMANIIIDDRSITSLPPNKSLRLVTAKILAMPLGVRDLDGPGLVVSPSKTIALSYARQLVENSFPAAQADLARFAATFVRSNTQIDLGATALLQNRASANVTASNQPPSEPPAARKEPVTARPAFSNLPTVREASPISAASTAESEIQPSPHFPPPPPARTVRLSDNDTEAVVPRWVLLTALGIPAFFGGILWLGRTRRRPARSLVRTTRAVSQAHVEIVSDTETSDPDDRTQLAEARADRAQEALRSGVLSWMKEKFVSTLFRHRAELLAAQHKAQLEMEQLERRLEQLHAPLHQRIRAYENRIAELEAKLASKGEENRHLLGARITLARQQLERSRFEAN